MQVAYRADSLIEAHLAKHALEGRDIPAFIFGESLLGGAGELPLFGVLRVCVADSHLEEARSCLQEFEIGQLAEDDALGDLDAVPGSS